MPLTTASLISLRALTAACTSLAHASAPILRGVAAPGVGNSRAGLVDKGFGKDFDPQTVADRRAQRFLEGGIRKAFPALRIVGEEGDALGDDSGDESGDGYVPASLDGYPDLSCLDSVWKEEADTMLPLEEVCVWIDPLDGTREFTNGNFQYVCTLIGITWKGKAVAGVVSEPYYYDYNKRPGDGDSSVRCLWGACLGGVGVHVLGDAAWRPAQADPKRCIVITSKSRTAGDVQESVLRLPPGLVTEHIQAGGAGHKMARVLEGAADLWLFPRDGTCKWDTCAGDALMQAVGGVVTDAKGAPLVYDPDAKSFANADGVIAASRPDLVEAAVAASVRPA